MQNSKKWSIIALASMILLSVAYFGSTGKLGGLKSNVLMSGEVNVCQPEKLPFYQEYKNTVSELDGLIADTKTLKVKIKESQSDIEGAESEIQARTKQNASHQSQVTKITRENKAICANPRLAPKCRQNRAQIAKLQNDIKINDKKIADFRKNKTQLENSLKEYEQQYNKLDATRLEKIAQIEKFEKQIEEACKPPVVSGEVTYRTAQWTCYNGTNKLYEDLSHSQDIHGCTNEDTWKSFAELSCAHKCSAESGKCGVNSFALGDICLTSAPRCGNGKLETGEQCDYGDKNNVYGCNSQCIFEKISLNFVSINDSKITVNYTKGFDTCVHLYSFKTNKILHTQNLFCQNVGGVTVDISNIPELKVGDKVYILHGNNGGLKSEVVTVGNENPDICEVAPELCPKAVCGNGKVETGEQCDDGNTDDGDVCSKDCSFVGICGNSVREGSEQCDDGNTTNGDGCSSACGQENSALYFDAAKKLVNLGIIEDFSAEPIKYRLSDPLLRHESIRITAKAIGGILENESSYMCTGVFSDIGKSYPLCSLAELSANAGLISSTGTFRPEDKLTRFEGLLFVIRSLKLLPENYNYSIDGVVSYAAQVNMIPKKEGFNPNIVVTRGEFFYYISQGLYAMPQPDICQILGTC